jgi:hypothetical protein
VDIKIDISPEAIERQIVDAVVKSGIGKRIETAVLSALNGYQFQRTVEEAASDAIRDMVREQVLKDDGLREKVREAMVAKLTDKHLEKLLAIALKIDRDL